MLNYTGTQNKKKGLYLRSHYHIPTYFGSLNTNLYSENLHHPPVLNKSPKKLRNPENRYIITFMHLGHHIPTYLHLPNRSDFQNSKGLTEYCGPCIYKMFPFLSNHHKRPLYAINHYELWKSDLRFVISDQKNHRVRDFKLANWRKIRALKHVSWWHNILWPPISL